MKTNMARFDRIIRFTIGFLFLIANIEGLIFGPTIMAISLVLMLTSIVGFCPIYALLGISSRKMH